MTTIKKAVPKFKGLFLPAVLLADNNLSLPEKIILADIKYFTGTYNFSYPSLAKKFHLNSRTVLRAVERLSGKLGLVESSGKTRNRGLRHTEAAERLFDETPKSETENVTGPGTEAVRLSRLFFELITARKTDYRKPDFTKWAGVIDLMIRIDKRTPEKIESVLRWVQADTGNGGNWKGWQAVILSPKKLREKFDKLEMQMEGNKNGTKEIVPGGHYR